MTLIERVTSAFQTEYGEPPSAIVLAPGRLNLLGGHTDYNEGYVLQFTIDRYVAIAVRPREDGKVIAHGLDSKTTVSIDLGDFQNRDNSWADDIKGVAWALGQADYALRGWEGVLASDIPAGLDLGIHAALSLAAIGIFAHVSGFVFDHDESINLALKAQTEWKDAMFSRSDFIVMMHNRPNSMMKIDCKTLEVEHIPFPRDASVILFDTGVRVTNIDDIKRQRQHDCKEAALSYKVESLRDLSMTRFEKENEDIEEPSFLQSRHVLNENGRVILAAEIIPSNALSTVGRLMTESHYSLRDDYGIGSPSLDAMVECALQSPNVLGARGTGSGMGGAVVALVKDFSETTAKTLSVACYRKKTGDAAEALSVRAVGTIETMIR